MSPTLNRCEVCKEAELNHEEAYHDYKRDLSLSGTGWQAARRGLGSNLDGMRVLSL